MHILWIDFCFGRVPSLRSGRATPHYAFAAVLCCASHCLTACSVSLTQEPWQVGRVYLFKCLFCKYLKINVKQGKNKI
ncbi:MAG: hypothetical protein NZ455_06495 [Bacteroidia bacterium]|nr:hypothetical protein [Bacteroidia bacterium]